MQKAEFDSFLLLIGTVHFNVCCEEPCHVMQIRREPLQENHAAAHGPQL